MTALKWIVKEAKKIKKDHPKRFSKWTDYVAQASAIYAKKHKGKSPIGKKKAKVGAIKKKTVKKSVVKNKAAIKKTATKNYHKDTKSHNVKISVVSGTPRLHFINKQEPLQKIKELINYNNDIEQFINKYKYILKNDKGDIKI